MEENEPETTVKERLVWLLIRALRQGEFGYEFSSEVDSELKALGYDTERQRRMLILGRPGGNKG